LRRRFPGIADDISNIAYVVAQCVGNIYW